MQAMLRRFLALGLGVSIAAGAFVACNDGRTGADDDDDDADGCAVFDETCSGDGDGPAPTGSGNGATSAASGGSNGLQQLCVDTINDYRASVGRPPLARWSSAESCSDQEAQSDGETNTPHGAFPSCGEFAQNECPGWPGPAEQMIIGCLDLMWDEGPGGGHYDNMENPQYTEVACGFATMSDGSIWAVQNFR
jgi:hypothetical protein